MILQSRALHDDSLQVFLNGFSARDIAQPLPSFDGTTGAAKIMAEMKRLGFQVAGVRQEGLLTGWLNLADSDAGRGFPAIQSFENDSILDDSAALNEVVGRLNGNPYLFIRTWGQVSGFIGRSDLQKPAMRMWLFGLITIMELRVTRMIDEVCPKDSWQKHLAQSRLEKAVQLQSERRKKRQDVRLLECLQFADKGRIVAREQTLRDATRFTSQSQVQRFVDSLQDLRNNLAHSHDISSDWKIICDLAANLHRIVLGPAHPQASAQWSSLDAGPAGDLTGEADG